MAMKRVAEVLTLAVMAIGSGCGAVDPYVNRSGICSPIGVIDPPEGEQEAISTITALYVSATHEPEPTVSVTFVSEIIEDPYVVPGQTIEVFGLECGCLNLIVYKPDDDYPFHRSGLAHEIAHCMGGDAQHTDPKWWPPGALVSQAVEALRSAGM
jgi:hypothetical protein